MSKIGKKKKYAPVSILNISMPYIYNQLIKMFNDVKICQGFDVLKIRNDLNIPKDGRVLR